MGRKTGIKRDLELERLILRKCKKASQQAVARELSISQAYVWKVVQRAKNELTEAGCHSSH